MSSDSRAATLPKRAEDRLIDALFVAFALARAGDAGSGYEALCVARCWALEDAAGEPWEADAVERWDGSLERFAKRWRVARA